MAIELKVPRVGESITEVQIGEWLKKEGDEVRTDETVVMIDTEKTTVELPAPGNGVITQILKQPGDMATVEEVIGYMDEAGAATAPKTAPAISETPGSAASEANAAGGFAPATTEQAQPAQKSEEKVVPNGAPSSSPASFVMPAAQRELEIRNLNAADVQATGPGGRLTKEDVLRHVGETPKPEVQTPAPAAAPTPAPAPVAKAPTPVPRAAAPEAEPRADEEVVPMTMLRRKIAEHLVNAQQTAALLTTFNEIDMSAVMAMRKEQQEAFQKKYNIKLGFMSFFIKASIDALKMYPGINAEIRGTNIVYRNHYDIGVAIGGGKGLVVPVLRNAERMSFAEIELQIAEYAKRAKENTLKPDELIGGTFTITNGGIYGSLLSTPIVNAPQSGILGMHAIQERPIARNGQVVIAPMMYTALTYDHRVVDGREAVSFLVRLKECIENPARMLIEV
jgi:2-oxoglutarate dehydrogenase E2 component (dihydrolipoamide succinyltransferase)